MRLPKQLPAVDRKPDMNASAQQGGQMGPAGWGSVLGPMLDQIL
jgi:hypothetical protein